MLQTWGKKTHTLDSLRKGTRLGRTWWPRAHIGTFSDHMLHTYLGNPKRASAGPGKTGTSMQASPHPYIFPQYSSLLSMGSWSLAGLGELQQRRSRRSGLDRFLTSSGATGKKQSSSCQETKQRPPVTATGRWHGLCPRGPLRRVFCG